MGRGNLLGLGLGLALVPACAPIGLEVEAARDLRCDSSQVSVEVQGDHAAARGCGKLARYVRECHGADASSCGWLPLDRDPRGWPLEEPRVADARARSEAASPPVTPPRDTTPIEVGEGVTAVASEARLQEWVGHTVRATHRDGRVVTATLRSMHGHTLVLGALAVWALEAVARVDLAEALPKPPVVATPDENEGEGQSEVDEGSRVEVDPAPVEAPTPRAPQAPVVIDVASYPAPWDAETSLEGWVGRDVTATDRAGVALTSTLKSLRSHALVFADGNVWPLERVARVVLQP